MNERCRSKYFTTFWGIIQSALSQKEWNYMAFFLLSFLRFSSSEMSCVTFYWKVQSTKIRTSYLLCLSSKAIVKYLICQIKRSEILRRQIISYSKCPSTEISHWHNTNTNRLISPTLKWNKIWRLEGQCDLISSKLIEISQHLKITFLCDNI